MNRTSHILDFSHSNPGFHSPSEFQGRDIATHGPFFLALNGTSERLFSAVLAELRANAMNAQNASPNALMSAACIPGISSSEWHYLERVPSRHEERKKYPFAASRHDRKAVPRVKTVISKGDRAPSRDSALVAVRGCTTDRFLPKVAPRWRRLQRLQARCACNFGCDPRNPRWVPHEAARRPRGCPAHTTATFTQWIGGNESKRQLHSSPPSRPIQSWPVVVPK
jgi:hypothetical protein